MTLEISTQHVQLTAPLKDYIEKKFEKFHQFFDNIQDIQVTLKVSHSSKQGDLQTVDVDIFASGIHIHATDTTQDLYASIDQVCEKCEIQLKKHKEKLRDNHRKRHMHNIKPSTPDPKPEELIDETKLYMKKPITPEDALKIIDEKANFFVFHNANTKAVNVLYRIEGSKYGLIETN